MKYIVLTLIFKIFKKKGAICDILPTDNQKLKAKYLLIPVTNKNSNVSVLLMKQIASNSILLNSNIFHNFYDDWKTAQSQSDTHETEKNEFYESNMKEVLISFGICLIISLHN